ncbi:MAG: leucine-rich repeat domain-containing protein [Kiritimatiellae bacterium]|nr:leucine-rich repeat domain-containing protein [Kiritimatiellia bacterium]
MYKIILITPLLLSLSVCAAPMATENYVNQKVASIEIIATNAAAVAATAIQPPGTNGFLRLEDLPAVESPDETDPRAMRLFHYGDPDIVITPASDFGFDSDTGTITGYTGSNPDIVLPYEIGGVPVVTIGISAFDGDIVLKTLTAPKTLTSIGSDAFADSSLTSLVAPALTTIDTGAFFVSSLTSLVAPALTTIGDLAFRSSSLTILTAPSLTTIGDYAFESSSLTTVYYGGNQPTAGVGIYDGTPTNLVSYVTDPTATGWGDNFRDRPVVRLPLYADAVYSGGSLVVTEATKELHQDTYTNLVWRNVFSNGWVWLVAYTNTPGGGQL